MFEVKDDEHCHQASRHSPRITLSLKDIQIKGEHDRPLYYTGYIWSSEVSCIQVDPGSTSSIMPSFKCQPSIKIKSQFYLKIRIWTNNSWKFGRQWRISTILSLRAKFTPMIEKMGYNLTKTSCLNFSKGRRTLFRSFVSRGKAPDYYQKT